jgi:hypothetical protein
VKGSLGRHLPLSLIEALSTQRPAGDIRWTGPSTVHQLRSVDAPSDRAVCWTAAPVEPAPAVRDFAVLRPDGVPRLSASAWAAGAAEDSPGLDGTASTRGAGTLIHRLLALCHQRGAFELSHIGRLADQLAAGGDDGGHALSALERSDASAIAARLLAASGLQPGSRAVFEAPYSRRLDDGRVERGTIDCLVFDGDRIEVLEFKTGPARAAHSVQLDAYVEAIRAAYPARRVEGRLVYVQAP